MGWSDDDEYICAVDAYKNLMRIYFGDDWNNTFTTDCINAGIRNLEVPKSTNIGL